MGITLKRGAIFGGVGPDGGQLGHELADLSLDIQPLSHLLAGAREAGAAEFHKHGASAHIRAFGLYAICQKARLHLLESLPQPRL